MSEDEGSVKGLVKRLHAGKRCWARPRCALKCMENPSLEHPTLKKNKYLRGYKAQIGFHIHCTWSLRPNTCKSGLIWSMPLHEYSVLPAVTQHSEHHACSAVTCSSTRQSQIASSIGLQKNSSCYSGVTKTQTILAKIEIRGRQVFTLRGFWFLDKTWWAEVKPPTSQWNQDLLLPLLSGRLSTQDSAGRMKSAVRSLVTGRGVWLHGGSLQHWTWARPGATSASHSGSHLPTHAAFFFLHNPIFKIFWINIPITPYFICQAPSTCFLWAWIQNWQLVIKL